MSKFLTHDEIILAIEARYGLVKVHNVKGSISVELLGEQVPTEELIVRHMSQLLDNIVYTSEPESKPEEKPIEPKKKKII